MASYKEELIHLHQLLAEVRFHSKENLGLPTEIGNLDNYSEVGIDSLTLDADIDKQLDAVLTLASDLASVCEQTKIPDQPTETAKVKMPKSGPSVQTTLTDIETGEKTTKAVNADTAESPTADKQQPTAPKATNASGNGEIVGEYKSDEEESVALEKTTLLDSWTETKERTEELPTETWGTPIEEGKGESEPVIPASSDGSSDEKVKQSEENLTEAKQVGEQLELPVQ